MKKQLSIHPAWAIKHRRKGTELRYISGKYYLYEYKTIYDSVNKKPKKISGLCLGTITEPGGFIASPKRLVEANKNLKVSQPILVKEYGVTQLVLQRFALYKNELEKHFKDVWKELLVIAYCRFIYHCPLKSIPYRLDSSFLKEELSIKSFSDKISSGILNQIGGREHDMQAYMKSFIAKGDYILMDGTQIVSKSQNIPLSKKGYNAHRNYDPQFNLMYIYSANQRMPVFYRLLPGNIRDVKAFKNTLLAAGLKKAIIVVDKGFYSKTNVELLDKEKLSYIIPLKRDNTIVPYDTIANNTFKTSASFFQHEKRMIWSKSFGIQKKKLHLFLDDSLRLKEEFDYLNRMQNKPEEYTKEKYNLARNKFGTIALLSNKMDQTSEDVYATYKSRMYIETMFDGMKNILEADHTYMQDEQTLKGWMFVNHICLQWYQDLYIELKTKELIKKISVNDYVQLLTDIKKVKINNTWHANEVTNATKKLAEQVGIKII